MGGFIFSEENKPKLLISGSAIGYYGIDKTDAVIEEKDNGDNSFSSELCQKWEEREHTKLNTL
jgi:NAD dependent epimerase/dehydratase family enzyme